MKIEIKDISQERLLEIYEKTKYLDGSVYKHEFLKPTFCPSCGNYRLDFDGEFQCPNVGLCKDKWDKKLELNL